MSHRTDRPALRERVHDRRQSRRDRWAHEEARRQARKAMDRAADNRVTGAVLVTIGANWLLMELGLSSIGWTGLVSLALAAMGLALMATAKAGSAAKYVVLGCLLTAVLVVSSSGATNPVKGKFAGDSPHRPAVLAEVDEEYSMGFGDLVLDLTRVEFEKEPMEIGASLIAGDIKVILPADAAVEIEARVSGAGEIRLLSNGEEHGAGGVGDRYRDRNWETANQRLRLDLDLDFGEIVVERAR